jgi:hypothetical protein
VGLFTAYLAYRYGRTRGELKAARDRVDDPLERCRRCGHLRLEHATDFWESCPE